MTEFFVHPDIAKVNGLSPGQLNWALDRLQGSLIETVESKSGQYRTIRLLPQYENAIAESKDCAAAKSLPPTTPDEERIIIDTEAVLARIGQARMETADLTYPSRHEGT